MTRKSRATDGVPAVGVRTALAVVAAATLSLPATAAANGSTASIAAATTTAFTVELESRSRVTTLGELAVPGASSPLLEQHTRRGGGSSRGGSSGGGGGQAVPRGGSGTSGGSGGGSSRGDGGSKSGTGDSGGNRGGSGAGTATGRSAADPGSSGSGTDTPTYSRPREGRPATGTAVERRRGDGTTVIVDRGGYYGGGLYPWGWGGIGLGGYYGYYDPWGWYDPYPPAVYAGQDYDGALKIKVKPRDAEVYVDGYFAGEVDDYDGLFQKLRLDAGPHRIELRLEGYEPLTFEVRIQPDRTVTYKGEMKKDGEGN